MRKKKKREREKIILWEAGYYFPNFLYPKCIVVNGTAIKIKDMIKS